MPAPQPKKAWPVLLIVLLVLSPFCLVGVVAVGAAIAIPAFISYTRRAKTAEATTNLRSMFVAASAYYEREHPGPDGQVLRHCTVDPASTEIVPGPQPQVAYPAGIPPSFRALDFYLDDPVYYQYEIDGPPGGCDRPADSAVYSFRAHGNLDGDTTLSMFELAVGTTPDNVLMRAPGFYILNELE